jgi:predicted ATPase/DNA-binding CsgD family transcriptional regulator/tRNA A-37 threonylcarbamoyl transferase component Bud32
MADRVGQHLGNYRLQRLLGRGGQASVYLGEHIYLHKPAARKLLRLHLDEHDADQFLREAQTLARLDHPHIVRVLDFAVQDSLPYLVMDYATGGTLRTKHLAGTRLPLELILTYVSQVASALQYAHDQRLIHRDIKPENMLLDGRSQVLLADFGLALLAPTHSASTQAMDPAMAGTAPYLAPEQVQGHPRAASDQYALAVVVYEWLAGQRPFQGTPIEVAMQHVSAVPPPLREHLPDLSPEVEQVVMRALAKAPEQRFPSIQDFATALHQAVHPTGDAFLTSAVPTPSTATAGEKRASEPFWKVPTSLTPLVGRQQEVASLCELLAHPDVRLLTFLGVGGIGKTRLSIQVASQLRDHFADGVCFVGLAPISDPSLALSSIAQELGLQEAGTQPLVETVKAWLRDKRFLLLLDNFEQIVSAAPLLEDLLAACTRLVILVTSREVLRLSAEHLFPVPPLSLPDLAQLPDHEHLSQYAAVSLFLQRAQVLQPDFQLTSTNARAIAEICVRLDGLPLAIELAAARIRLFPPQALLTRLSQRLQVLTGGSRSLPERQQTLRNTIKWSYDLLNKEEQRLFRRLSVFVGGCRLSAAEAVCGTSNDVSDGMGISVLDGVASLIDKSLLQQVEQGGEEPRLAMLETIREFGLACLEQQEELQATRQAHARYYLALAEQAEPHLFGCEQLRWLDRLERELDNLRAILQAGIAGGAEEREEALRLGAALRIFWFGRRDLREGRTALERLLAGAGMIADPVRLKALNTLGILLWTQYDTRDLEPVADEALALARTLGNQELMTTALFLRGITMMYERRDYARAQACLEEALASARALGDRLALYNALACLGLLAWLQHDAPRASAWIEEVLIQCRAVGEQLLMSSALVALAMVELSQGHAARAHTLLEESMSISRAFGHPWGVAIALRLLGVLALQQGALSQAEAFLAESARLASEVGERRVVTYSRLQLATLAMMRGEFGTARQWYEEGLATALDMGLTNYIASGLKGLGCVAAAQGLPTWAALLWGTAEPLHESLSEAIPQTGGYLVAIPQTLYDRMVAEVRRQLGEAAFTAASARGRSMTPEQALAAQGTAEMPLSAPTKPPSPPPAKTSSTYPSGLNAREVEVLRLVAQGLTDAQVADQLVISLRTVNFHLISIYSKLGVSSRAAATRYATEQHLL